MPEYIGINNNLIINMDHLKAFGKITQLIPEKIDDSLINEKAARKNSRSRRASQEARSDQPMELNNDKVILNTEIGIIPELRKEEER